MRQEKKEVARVVRENRTILNTNWPVESVVERIQEEGKVSWLATYDICNGIASGSRRFRSKAEAIASIQ